MPEPALTDPPVDNRARELWLNHAAGYMLIRDVRDYARSCIDPALSQAEMSIARKSIDDALYGMMMVLDGVTSGLANERYRVDLLSYLVLSECQGDQEIELERTDRFEGFCMGYHSWIEGDFGEFPVVKE